jgi:large subunit ribosomal protein L13
MEKTYLPSQDSLEQNWYVVDAADQRLGRLASEIAMILRGKNKPTYTPHMDTGDFVVVINAEKVAVTGKKRTQKLYRRHSGRPGGMKTETFAKLQARVPERIIEQAVKGMLPKNSLGRQLFTKLKVYTGAAHPHQAQKPQVLDNPDHPRRRKVNASSRINQSCCVLGYRSP